jgi:uncharacterized protein (TIGR03437 family)
VGQFNFGIMIEDATKTQGGTTFTIVVRLPAGVQTGATILPSAIANFQYHIGLDDRLTAPRYYWLLSGGTVPPGLTMNVAGILQGIPTRVGTYGFKATVAATSGIETVFREYVITITTAEIATIGLPNASRGVPYSYKLEARNGKTPYTWSLLSGELPSRLELTEAGEIQGTPDTLGTSTFEVRVKDGVSNTATGTFTLLVERPVEPLAMATTALAEAQAGVAYRFSLRATGGRPPYTFLLSSSSLPLGLALSGSGELTGVPTRVGPFTFSVQVVDSGGSSITKLFTLQVGQPTPAIKDGGVLNAASLQPGTAPGTWMSIFGQNLASADVNRAWRSSDFINGELPVSLENTQVRIAGQPAFVQYVSPTQLNVLMPPTDARGTAEVVVTTPTGSARATTRIDSAAPALFAATGLAAGLHAAAVHADGAAVGDPRVAASARAARPGDRILLFGTGFGATNPDQRPSLGMTPAPLAAPFEVFIGGVNAQADFGGIVGPGLYQFNVLVPEVAAGEQPVVIRIGGAQSQAGVTLHVE